jgi:septum formation protein
MSKKFNLILASKSPRRQQLLRDLGIDFTVKTKEVDENFPNNLKAENIPLYLCVHKANSFEEEITEPNTVVLTADTIVWVNNQVLNKPKDFDEALRMLQMLSGNRHQVFTAVCLKSKQKTKSFYCTSDVYFNELTTEQIKKYVTVCQPYDKAGAYGAQECLPLGMNPCSIEEIAFLKSVNRLDIIEKSVLKINPEMHQVCVKKIEGSYFNVMGLPLVEVYQALAEY